MAKFDDVAAFILAGGASARMGRDKALLEIAGLPMAVRTARLVEPLVSSVTLVGPVECLSSLDLAVIPDDLPGRGPLGGIATALRVSTSPWCLILGCDLPYLNGPWLEYLVARALAGSGDVLLPESERGPEPLCAMYHTRCLPVVAAALRRGVRKVTDGLTGLLIEQAGQDKWKAFDSNGRLFKNMNAPADYREALAYFAAEPRA